MPGAHLRSGGSVGDHAARLVPNQPWADIRGMGNQLRHAYDRLSLPIMWHAVHEELPALEADVRQALIAMRARERG